MRQELVIPLDHCAQLFAVIFEPGDWIEFRCHNQSKPGAVSHWIKYSEDTLREIAPTLDRLNDQGYSIYFGANPRTHSGGKTAKDVECARCVFVDIENTTADAVMDLIVKSYNTHNWPRPLERPCAVVNSGGGVHLWWRLEYEFLKDIEGAWRREQKQMILQMAKIVEGSGAKVDGCIHDAPRIMRAPGWINRKAERNGARALLMMVDEKARYKHDIATLYEDEIAVQSSELPAITYDEPPLLMKDLRYFVERALRGEWDKSAGRRTTIFQAASIMAGRGIRLEDAQQQLSAAAALMFDDDHPRLLAHEITDIKRQVYNKYKHMADKGNIDPSLLDPAPLHAVTVAITQEHTDRAGLSQAIEQTLEDIQGFRGLTRIGLDVPSMPSMTWRLFGMRGLIMCGGMPGCGKTVLAMQAALDAVRANDDVCAVLLSCEMSRAEIITRWLSQMAGCTDRDVMVTKDATLQRKIAAAAVELQRLAVSATSGKDRIFIHEPSDMPRLIGTDGQGLITMINSAKRNSGCSRSFTVCDPFQGMPYTTHNKGDMDRDRDLMAYLLAASRGTSEHDPLLVVTETTKSSWRDVPDMADMLGSGRLGYSGDIALTLRQVKINQGSATHAAVRDEIDGQDPIDHRLIQMRIVKGRRCTIRGTVWFILNTLRSCMTEVKNQDVMSQAHQASREDEDGEPYAKRR
jgi:KaiC/GvpD/RAD55 family RecA-like ATPase